MLLAIGHVVTATLPVTSCFGRVISLTRLAGDVIPRLVAVSDWYSA
jgi:hypothetical protein